MQSNMDVKQRIAKGAYDKLVPPADKDEAAEKSSWFTNSQAYNDLQAKRKEVGGAASAPKDVEGWGAMLGASILLGDDMKSLSVYKIKDRDSYQLHKSSYVAAFRSFTKDKADFLEKYSSTLEDMSINEAIAMLEAASAALTPEEFNRISIDVISQNITTAADAERLEIVNGFTPHHAAIQEALKDLKIIAKYTTPQGTKTSELLDGLKGNGYDAVLLAHTNGYQIDGVAPVEWAVKNSVKIAGKHPIEWAVLNNVLIAGKNAVELAVRNDIQIDGKHPVLYATAIQDFQIDGKPVLAWAEHNDKTINGQKIGSYLMHGGSSGKGFKIDGKHPAHFLKEHNILLEHEDVIAATYDKGETIESKNSIEWALENSHKVSVGKEEIHPLIWVLQEKGDVLLPGGQALTRALNSEDLAVKQHAFKLAAEKGWNVQEDGKQHDLLEYMVDKDGSGASMGSLDAVSFAEGRNIKFSGRSASAHLEWLKGQREATKIEGGWEQVEKEKAVKQEEKPVKAVKEEKKEERQEVKEVVQNKGVREELAELAKEYAKEMRGKAQETERAQEIKKQYDKIATRIVAQEDSKVSLDDPEVKKVLSAKPGILAMKLEKALKAHAKEGVGQQKVEDMVLDIVLRSPIELTAALTQAAENAEEFEKNPLAPLYKLAELILQFLKSKDEKISTSDITKVIQGVNNLELTHEERIKAENIYRFHAVQGVD